MNKSKSSIYEELKRNLINGLNDKSNSGLDIENGSAVSKNKLIDKLDSEDIVRGIIFSEILDKPLCKRRKRSLRGDK